MDTAVDFVLFSRALLPSSPHFVAHLSHPAVVVLDVYNVFSAADSQSYVLSAT